jgi:branched-chain amino acid transport system substrate-binding protein
MKSTRSAYISVAVALMLVGLLAGCGSSKSSTSPTSPTSPTSSGSSGSSPGGGSELNVGMIGWFSGALGSSFGGIPKVMDAWASTVNASGGLSGRTVHMISKDASTGVGLGLTYAKELIDQDHVVAIVDADESPDDATWLPYATAQHVPVIFASGLGQSKASFEDADLFPVIGESPQIIDAFAQQARKLGPKFGYVYCAESPSCAAVGKLLTYIGKSIGLTLPVDESASSSAPDYTAVCQNLKDHGVNSYYLAFASAAAKRITDTCYQQGLRVPQLLTAGTAAPYWKTDPAFKGFTVLDKSAPYFLSTTVAEKAYRSALTKYAPSLVGTDLDNASDIWAWSAGQLLSAAAKNPNGAATTTSITEGLYELKNETLGGLVQPLNYVKGKPTWLPCNFVWQVGTDANFVAPDSQPVCAPQNVVNSLTEEFAK